jgi:protein TonB
LVDGEAVGKGTCFAAALALLLGPSFDGAHAQPAPPAASSVDAVIDSPHWRRRPSGDDMARAYPDHAFGKQVRGSVALLCEVGPDGKLAACAVSQEDPTGFGFGDATLKISKAYQIEPQLADGSQAAGRKVVVRVRWMACGLASGGVVCN